MPRYLSMDPKTELNGRTVSSFITNIKHDDIKNVLIQHKLDHINPDEWYSLQSVLNVLSDISNEVNAPENMVAVGMAAAQLGLEKLPAAYADATLEQWIRAYCETIYHQRHRNGFAGTLSVRMDSAVHLVITTKIPYPDDLMYGVFYAYTRHFRPNKMPFSLQYDPHSPHRENGGETTIYHILIG